MSHSSQARFAEARKANARKASTEKGLDAAPSGVGVATGRSAGGKVSTEGVGPLVLRPPPTSLPGVLALEGCAEGPA